MDTPTPLDDSNLDAHLRSVTYDAAHWAYELKQCEENLDYLAANYLKIKASKTIGFPTLKFNPPQRRLYEKIRDQWKRTGWVRQVWGKVRQFGSTTLGRALAFHQTAFKNDRNSFLVAHREPDSWEIFDTDLRFYDSLPVHLRPKTRYRSKTKIDFLHRRSQITVGHALNVHVGASHMNHIVHLTEAARYPNGKEVQASLFPSISAARGEDCSMVIIESTSRMGGTWFKDFAEAARDGHTEYEFTFVPWFEHEDYRIPVPTRFELTQEEQEWIKEHHIPIEAIAWRRLSRANYRRNLAFFDQEYPFTWESSWILPADASQMFTEEMLVYLVNHLRPGIRFEPTSDGLDYKLDGKLEVWEDPSPLHEYDIGIDIAEGATDEADYSVLEVIRRDTLEQVAEARGHWDPADSEFFDLVYWTGMIYNRAQLNPDITGGWGHALLVDLQKRNYPNIWQWRRHDDVKGRVSTRLGFLYTQREKSTLVSNAVSTTKREQPIIHSRMLKSELRTFLQIGIGEWSAPPGAYDDSANAWMLAILAATDERRPLPSKDLGDVTVPTLPAYACHDVDADLQHSRRTQGWMAQQSKNITNINDLVRRMPWGRRDS